MQCRPNLSLSRFPWFLSLPLPMSLLFDAPFPWGNFFSYTIFIFVFSVVGGFCLIGKASSSDWCTILSNLSSCFWRPYKFGYRQRWYVLRLLYLNPYMLNFGRRLLTTTTSLETPIPHWRLIFQYFSLKKSARKVMMLLWWSWERKGCGRSELPVFAADFGCHRLYLSFPCLSAGECLIF